MFFHVSDLNPQVIPISTILPQAVESCKKRKVVSDFSRLFLTALVSSVWATVMQLVCIRAEPWEVGHSTVGFESHYLLNNLIVTDFWEWKEKKKHL